MKKKFAIRDIDFLLRVRKSINNFATEEKTTNLKEKKHLCSRLNRLLRCFLFTFNFHRQLRSLPELKFQFPDKSILSTKISEEDLTRFTTLMIRSVVVEACWYLELFFEAAARESNLSLKEATNNYFGGIFPSSIKILRLMRNSFHNDGVHRPRQAPFSSTHVFKGKKFIFKNNRKILYFHPLFILDLIDDAAFHILSVK